jgi:hypothetical protein
VRPSITHKESKCFNFRSGEEDINQNYSAVGLTDWEIAKTGNNMREYWVLLRTIPIAVDECSQLLSFTRLNAMSDVHSSNNKFCVSQKLMSVTRQCVSARLPNTCATVNKKKLIKKKLLTSCLRVGRVSGPYGHAGGRELNELRILCCSQLVKNAMPRSKLGSIVVSYHAAGQKKTICELIPYYIGVKDKVCRAVSPPFNAIPRLGSIVNNKDVSTKLQQQKTNETFVSKTCTQVFKTEVASLFSGACILSGLFR